jgi:Zn-dependent protease with chaperone function
MIVIRVAYAVARVAVPQWWLRRRHAAALRVLARHDPTHDILVVEHPVPAAYCLPARGGSIVVSEGAVRRLDPQLLEAVVAHERAHLRGRHYLITTSAAVLARAFARLPLFTAAEQELRCLVEMAADDAAARRTTPRTVARALLDLVADPSPPAPALGMSGPAAAERVRRLIAPRRPLNAATRCLCVATAVSSLVLPLAAPTVPALFDDAAHCVPAAAATAALSSL